MHYKPHGFDDLVLGARFECGPRTVSLEDIAAFAVLSGDRTALHTDAEYAAATPLGGLVAHGVLNLAVATGLAYEMGIFEGTVLAIRAMEIRYERPVQPADGLTLELSVTSLDERPRVDRGRTTFDVTLRNQEQRVVLSGSWDMLLRRGSGARKGA